MLYTVLLSLIPAFVAAMLGVLGASIGHFTVIIEFLTGFSSGFIVGFIYIKKMVKLGVDHPQFKSRSIIYGTLAGFISGAVVYVPAVFIYFFDNKKDVSSVADFIMMLFLGAGALSGIVAGFILSFVMASLIRKYYDKLQ